MGTPKNPGQIAIALMALRAERTGLSLVPEKSKRDQQEMEDIAIEMGFTMTELRKFISIVILPAAAKGCGLFVNNSLEADFQEKAEVIALAFARKVGEQITLKDFTEQYEHWAKKIGMPREALLQFYVKEVLEYNVAKLKA